MKTIKITSEWIIEMLTNDFYADGQGNAIITTDTIADSHWIDLALNTVGVKYEKKKIEFPQESEKKNFQIQWTFKFEDIESVCPKKYKNLIKLNDSNDALFQAQQ